MKIENKFRSIKIENLNQKEFLIKMQNSTILIELF